MPSSLDRVRVIRGLVSENIDARRARGGGYNQPYHRKSRSMAIAPHAAPSSTARFADAQALSAADMAAVDALIRTRLASDVVLINQIAEHIVAGGGKRLRPMLRAAGRAARGLPRQRSHQLAAIIEFIHTATLLHDDVVDESDLRRGRKTANALWGNAASVLVGDFLYSRTFQLMVEPDDMRDHAHPRRYHQRDRRRRGAAAAAHRATRIRTRPPTCA